MKLRISDLRHIIREVLEEQGLTFYHGTLKDAVPSILRTGLRAGQGWGGAAKPGVFLSTSPDSALYWAKMSFLTRHGLPAEESSFDRVDPSQLVVLRVDVPPEERSNIVPRQRSYNLAGDSQYVGSVPPGWISVL
ncbi:MAG: hypothetical protein EBR82_00725 [Caulobacteraceae bacterium]|nr:hypothetical protein [Caulobacteraceae bacterium]